MDFEVAKVLVTTILVSFALLELVVGRFWQEGAAPRDLAIEAVSTLTILLVVVPLIMEGGALLAGLFVADSEGMLAWLPWWAMLGILFVGDDMTQYWWHRASHSSWLYPLHRAHHSAPYMSVRLTYRNNLFYYLLMPGVWVSAVLVYWGFGAVYTVYIVAKLLVIIGAHSSVPWDAPLYRWRWSQPLMWVVERVISTPSTHSAHHGLYATDGVTHYKGNFGNFLFLWDVLFGTARITRRRPEAYGIEGLEPVPWYRELFVPAPMRWVEEGSPSASEAGVS
jgi:sterol desaturase/sphingolipid hydroxylase (fatty acid hydroxylase superfamily)